jgi:hypothetical protein
MIDSAPLLAALVLPLLLYLPGWAAQARLGRPADLLERQFERVAVSALWSGWLALLLAALGVFSLWLHLGLTLAASAAFAFLPGPRAARGADAPTPRWEPIAHAAVLAVALLVVARPFETVLGVRDAGVYATTGFAIARTGALVQEDPLLAQLAADAASADPAVAEPAKQALSNYTLGQPRDRYIATRLRAAGFFVYEGELATGRVVPQGLHLLPAWIGLLTAAGGAYVGLFAPGLLGVLGVWSVGMLGRRLAGPWVGLLAMGLLGLNGAQVWFSRYTTAETVAQFLIWAGLYFFAKMQVERGRPAVVAAALAGLAIGQVALARLDFFLLGPVLLYLIYCWVARRWALPQTALAAGLALMLTHAGLHIALIARAYFFDTGHERLLDSAVVALFSLPFLTEPLRLKFYEASAGRPLRLLVELLLLGVGVAALVVLRTRAGALGRATGWLAARRDAALRVVFAAVLLVSAYAYLVRPGIIDADMLFNTRGGWDDPLTRDPALVAQDVHDGRMTRNEARTMAGVALEPSPNWWEATPVLAETEALRARLAAERGPWAGPLSNQTVNWLRLQGYVGAPVRFPVSYWYAEYDEMSWWQIATTDPATLGSEPVPLKDKYLIPLGNMVRMGWYLSPLGVILGCVGYALWWRRGLNAASWLFLSVAFVGTFFYVRQTFGTSDQHYIYILRRFVPIAYPAFALGIAYALVALAGPWRRAAGGLLALTRPAVAAGLAGLLLLFLAWTNRPIFAHVEYRGAVAQLEALAARFEPGRDVLLMRGGAPIFAESRDVPDLVATPLRFGYGIDAFAVKSSVPGNYANDLAAAARRWREQGREVYLLLSASGASLALPGFALEPAGEVTLDVPEFEQLTDQKPRNVSGLTLPFVIYRAVPADAPTLAAPPSGSSGAFAAQVVGFYRPEARADGSRYSWTNGEATLRLPWPAGAAPAELRLTLAGGRRPAHLGAADVCFSALPEGQPWPAAAGTPVELGCLELGEQPASYSLRLDPAALPPAPSGTLLLRIASPSWVPAAEDPRQNDRRAVGVQFGGYEIR